MPLMDIATGRVIEEVKKRRMLWDKTCPFHKNKWSRRSAWIEIFCTLVPDFKKLPRVQQSEIDKAIQQRWKTARDAYMRTKAGIKTGAVAKKYFYYDHCSFLDGNEQLSTDEPPEKRLKGDNPVDAPSGQAQPSSSALTSAPASPVDSPSSNDADLIQLKQEYEDVEEDLTCEEDKQNGAEENDHDQTLGHQDLDLGANAQLHTELDLPLKIEYVSDVPPTSEVSHPRENDKNPQHCNYEIFSMLKETSEQLKNDNMAFFMSLLPIVNKFSDRKKLLFRSEVIRAAMELSSTEQDD